jgi:hypothetical protein
MVQHLTKKTLLSAQHLVRRELSNSLF